MTLLTGTTPALTDLTAAVRSAVHAHTDWARTAQLVAEALRRHLPGPGVLTAAQRLGDPDRPTGHLLYAEPDGTFSVLGLVWRPGQTTRIHDHITWCVVGVLQGIEHEDLYDERLNLIGENHNQRGTVTASRRRATSTGSGTPAPRPRSPCTSTAPTSAGSAAALAVTTTNGVGPAGRLSASVRKFVGVMVAGGWGSARVRGVRSWRAGPEDRRW